MTENNNALMEERFENHKNICQELENHGYQKTEVTITILKANFMAFLTAGSIALIFILMYIIFGKYEFDNYKHFSILFAIIISVPVHKSLHGAFWAISCKKKFKSIQFGIILKNLTPYCHCKEFIYIAVLFGASCSNGYSGNYSFNNCRRYWKSTGSRSWSY